MLNYNSIALCALIFTPLTFASNQADENDYRVSQSDFGGTGLMQVPSARMAEAGEFNMGGNWNSDYHHYTASIQLLDWLETTIRYTRVPDILFSNDADYSGDNIYTDKGIDFKVRLWEESYWLPEASIGIRDFGGTGLFDGEFVAASKRFGSFDFTVGMGWGYLGQSGNFTNPFCKASDKYCTRPSDFKDNGGSVDFNRWFKGPAALFGGVEYHTPYKPLRLKVEYDSNDYSQDFIVQRGGEMPQDRKINVGALYQIGDWADLKISYQRGNTVTLGANIYTNFNELSAVWRDEPKVEITRPYSDLVDSESSYKSDVDWNQVSELLATNAGYIQSSITVNDNTVTVFAEQTKYRDRTEALERVSAILHNAAPANVTTFKIIELKQGLVLTETDIDRKTYVFAANRMSIDAKEQDAFKSYQATETEIDQRNTDQVSDTRKKWEYGFEPVLAQSLGGAEAFYLYNFGINANANVWISDKIELGGSVYFNIVDNYDKYNYVENSPHIRNHATPRVRTLFRAYVHDNPVRLSNLQLTWFEQPTESIYTQMYGGYLEMMFAGVGGEVLYRPNHTNWAIGLDANLISQRDPESWFGVFGDDYFYYDGYGPENCAQGSYTCQAYVLNQGTTGHLTGYYMPNWLFLDDTLLKLSVGKFLGGDQGFRVDFSKQFNSGVIVGAYATLTDLTADEYGEGSYNKGFYISIPLDIMTIKPSTQRANIKWEPITRDGGQMLNKKHYLFNKTDARSSWYERPNTSH